MKVSVDRGPRLQPWELDALTVADCDQHLVVLRRMAAKNAASVFPGRAERARHIAGAITALLDARLELAEHEVLDGIDDESLPELRWGSAEVVDA